MPIDQLARVRLQAAFPEDIVAMAVARSTLSYR